MSGVLSVWSKATRPGSRAEPTVALPYEYAVFINQAHSSCSAVCSIYLSSYLSAWPLSTRPHGVISAPAWTFVMRFVSFQCFLLKHILHVLSDKVHGITTINHIFNNWYSMCFLTLSVCIMDSEITGCDWRKEQHWENTCLYKLNLLSLTDMQLVRHAVIL